MTQRKGGSSPARPAAPKTVADAQAILRDMAAASVAFDETFADESVRIGPGTDGRYRSLVEQIPAVGGDVAALFA